MHKYVMISLFYVTVSFGAQTSIVPAQVPVKQYAALLVHTTQAVSTWSFVPSDLEKEFKRHRISVAALLDEPNEVSINDEIRTLYETLFDTECENDASQSMAATALQPETKSRIRRGYRGTLRGHGYMRGHKRPGRRYVRQPKKSE